MIVSLFFLHHLIVLNYKNNDFKEIEILLVNIHRGYFNLQFFVQKKDDVLYFNDLTR